MRIVKIISVLMLTLVLAGCSTSQRLYNVTQAVVPTNQTTDSTADAIKKALSYKRWDVLSEEPGKIMARVKVRQHEATIAITYTEKTFSIKHVDSYLLDHNSGRNTIHRNYNKWIKLLKDEINYYFANPTAQQVHHG